MTLALLLAVATASAGPPSPGAAPVSASGDGHEKVFVFGVRADGADETLAHVVERRIVDEALALRLDPLGRDELRSLLDVEAAQQATGCEGDASCLAEIAGGVGAELVVTGTLSALADHHYALSLSLFDSKRAAILARVSAEADSADDLKDAVRPAARRLFTPLVGAARASSSTSSSPSSSSSSSSPWPAVLLWGGGAGVFAGVVVAGVGALPLLDANGRAADAQAAANRFRAGGSDAALEDLAGAHDAYESARASWSSWGLPVAVAGGAVAVLGAAALVGGALTLE